MTNHKGILESFGGAFDIVAMAASAGGLKALINVLSGLPQDFPAAIVVVQHLDPPALQPHGHNTQQADGPEGQGRRRGREDLHVHGLHSHARSPPAGEL